jgi:uncharacterized membrane protein YphA (DoxX/SURF4 family)
VSQPWWSPEAVWVSRTVVALTFVVSATGKFRDLDGLRRGVADYDVLPARVARRLAPLLPVAELALAVMLLGDLAARQAAAAAVALYGVFALAVGVNVARGRRIPCHCFGGSTTERIGPVTLARLGLLAALAIGVAQHRGPTVGVLPPAQGAARWIPG